MDKWGQLPIIPKPEEGSVSRSVRSIFLILIPIVMLIVFLYSVSTTVVIKSVLLITSVPFAAGLFWGMVKVSIWERRGRLKLHVQHLADFDIGCCDENV
jgi:hypothetical protein